jgi:hypothetical protein
MNKQRTDYYDNGEWRVCKPLNKKYKSIVNDLMNSSCVSHSWSEEKKYQYFYRVVSIVYDLATKKPKSKFSKIKDKVIESLCVWWYKSNIFRD